MAIAPDDTTGLVAIDFETEDGDDTDPTLRVQLDVDAAVQLTDLLNGFFASDDQPTPYEQVLELIPRCGAYELHKLTGLLIRSFAGQDGAK